jgi:long-chain acyl-CoA synthetase
MAWLGSRIIAIAEAEPDRPAVVEGAQRVSYGALWTEVRRFAEALRARGIAPGERVAVLLPNSVAAIVVVVPLNVQARARDFGPWLAHSRARAVVHEAGNADVDEALAGLGSGCEVRLTVSRTTPAAGALEWLPAAAVGGPAVAERPSASDTEESRAPALVLYTSGTTGRPKGVVLSHANVVANVDAVVAYLELTGADSIVSSLPFYYSYGASVLHTHLAVGARLVIEPNLIFPHVLVETMARERVTGLSGVPSTFALLLQRVQLAKHDLSSLRYVTQAGGGMAPALTRRVRDALPQARLFVMYGQTEATARLTWLPPSRLDEKPGSVGVPIAGVTIEVRREGGEHASRGEVGEVWARGASIMLGFLDDEAATREVLQDGWLATGDMGHLDDEGFLFLVGRRSDMIKTGAHRIHPADVEEVIAELDEVVEVAAVGIDDPLLGQTIKVFVVVASALSPERVKAHCHGRLAAYKIPKHIEFVSFLPKTASGKVQRAKLAAPRGQETP